MATPEPVGAFDFSGKGFHEGYELWKTGCEIWMAYISEVSSARTPAALVEANTRLMARSLDITGFAAGHMLADQGLAAPTLNEP